MSVEHWQDELQRRIEKLTTSVNDLRLMETTGGASEFEKKKQVDACARCLEDVREARKNCDRAVRIIKDNNLKLQGKDMLRKMDTNIRSLQDEMRRCELNLNKSPHSVVDLANSATDEEYKREIDRIQGDMKESYARQIHKIDQTLDVASTARESVEYQGEQIHNIANETKRMGENLERADVVVRRFKKQVSSDRVFHMLLAGNLLVLIILLTYVIINRKLILDAIGL